MRLLGILFLLFASSLHTGTIISTSVVAQDSAWKNDPFVAKLEPREFTDTAQTILRYRFYAPSVRSESKLPLIIFLHGAGERGEDNISQLKHGVKQFVSESFQDDLPCFMIAPQCPADRRWVDVDWSVQTVEQPKEPTAEMSALLELIESVLQEFPVDQERVYITGLSMGGFGTWDAVFRRPDLFAGALPICGGGDPKLAANIKELPVWCFHGDSDPVVTVELSRAMIAAIKHAGGNPKYTEYPGVAHDSWTQTYSDKSIFHWLFEQRRTQQGNN